MFVWALLYFSAWMFYSVSYFHEVTNPTLPNNQKKKIKKERKKAPSSWIPSLQTLKRIKNLKLVIFCWVIAAGQSIKKSLRLGSNLPNWTKNVLTMFAISNNNSPKSFILILLRIQKKQKMYHLISSNDYDKVKNIQVWG